MTSIKLHDKIKHHPQVETRNQVQQQPTPMANQTKGTDTRTNFRMDSGPQMPTNETGMLKFGTNLLQTVDQFNGHHMILVAYMSVASMPERPVLPPVPVYSTATFRNKGNRINSNHNNPIIHHHNPSILKERAHRLKFPWIGVVNRSQAYINKCCYGYCKAQRT